MNYILKNGLFLMESGNELIIPCMDESYDDVINFDTKVSPLALDRFNGDFKICAEIIPVNMSLGDEYGIYAFNEAEKYVYIKMVSDIRGNLLKSGCVDSMEQENPDVNVSKESIHLEMKKCGDKFNLAYSTDGKEFTNLGNVILDNTLFSNVGFGLTSFQGSQFYIRVKNIIIDEGILI